MSTTTGQREAGRLLAERLRLKIIDTEGHDLKVPCVSCQSSDAGRVHTDTGVYFCYACQKALNAFDLCKVVLGDDQDQAKRVMIDVGLFEDRSNGNGHAANSNGTAKTSDNEIIDQAARHKGTTGDGFRAYGAVVKNGKVTFPTFKLDDGKAERISYFYIDPKNPSDKGRNGKDKSAGIFLPVIPAATASDKPRVRRPQPGETWIICEGGKNAAAYHGLGRNAIGLNGKHVKRDFLPGFVAAIKGVDVVFVPDGDLQSAEAFKGLGTALHGTAKSVRLASLPYADQLRDTGGDDVRDVLKQFGTDGPQVVRDAIAAAKRIGKDGEVEETIDLGIITAAELLRKDCSVEFLIPDVLAKGQHHILGGPLKCCKSLIATDLAVSLAMGGKFLDHFPAARPVRTIILSGESGWPVFQENIRRISTARGATEQQLENLLTGVRLPKFGNSLHQDAICTYIVEQKAEAVIFDCAYRCIPGDQVSNQFAMGEVLDSIGNALEAVGATLILLCHTPKHVAPGDPLELDNVAFAGFSEFAAQWFIVNRQTRYEPGTGRHFLWAVVGGRAGHSGTYALDLDEGEFHQDQDREWRVAVTRADEARRGQQEQRKQEQEAKRAEKLEETKKRILDAAAKYKVGETSTVIRDRAGLNDRDFKPALVALLDGGELSSVEIFKSNRKAPYPGIILASYQTTQE